MFELLRAKLDVPTPRPGLVERTRLVGRLSRKRSGRVVSVVAPPGYGKTTVLGQWAARDGREFAWLSLDHRDNDPVVFLTYVAEALNADATIDPAVFKALMGPGDSLWARGLPGLVVGTGRAARAARARPRRRARAREPRLPGRPCGTAPPRAARLAAGALRAC